MAYINDDQSQGVFQLQGGLLFRLPISSTCFRFLPSVFAMTPKHSSKAALTSSYERVD
jgi:hypothetical protein